jgi:hypothetical protein
LPILFSTPIEALISYSSLKEAISFNQDFDFLEWTIKHRDIGIFGKERDELISETARQFGVDEDCVHIMGSARYGFSPTPKLVNGKVAKFPGRPFSEDSDVDITIISTQLFDTIWQDIYDQFPYFRKYNFRDFSRFSEFLYRGWMRADQIPLRHPWYRRWREKSVAISDRAIGSKLEVSVALFRNDYFMKRKLEGTIHTMMSEY